VFNCVCLTIQRDRSTIVDDSIEYVKNLHHRIKVLQQRKLEMKQSATPALSPRTIQHTPTQRGRITTVAAEAVAEAGAAAAQKLSRRDEDCKTQIKVGATKEDLNEIHALLRSCLEKIDIHVDLPHQVLIELVCRPQRHFQSLIFQCLESLRLDVSQCSITKAAHRVVCVVSAQVQNELKLHLTFAQFLNKERNFDDEQPLQFELVSTRRKHVMHTNANHGHSLRWMNE
jgi:hypothetical protein